jgi:hypothetical protein
MLYVTETGGYRHTAVLVALAGEFRDAIMLWVEGAESEANTQTRQVNDDNYQITATYT